MLCMDAAKGEGFLSSSKALKIITANVAGFLFVSQVYTVNHILVQMHI